MGCIRLGSLWGRNFEWLPTESLRRYNAQDRCLYLFFLLNSVKKLYAIIFLDRIRISVGTSGIGQHSRGIFHVGEVVVSEEIRSAIGELSKYLHLFKQKLSGNESTPVFNILPLIIKMH